MTTSRWTHVVAINQIIQDPAANSPRIELQILQGKGAGKVLTSSFSSLMLIDRMENATTLARIDLVENHLEDLHPGMTAVDGVSLAMMKMLGAPFESLRSAWIETSSYSPKQIFPTGDGSQIIYEGRRYHWMGQNKGLQFLENQITFAGEFPESRLLDIKFKPLREAVDHPGIPKHAIATNAWSANNNTTVTYDVEDVSMNIVFGDITRQEVGIQD